MKSAHKKSPVLTMSCDVPQVELEPSRVTGLIRVSTTAIKESRRYGELGVIRLGKYDTIA